MFVVKFGRESMAIDGEFSGVRMSCSILFYFVDICIPAGGAN